MIETGFTGVLPMNPRRRSMPTGCLPMWQAHAG